MIAITRRVVRKVPTTKHGLLVVALTPEGLWLKSYRKRTAFLLPYDVALYRAQVLAADATKVVAPRKPKRKG
jgi:hypothetical protein